MFQLIKKLQKRFFDMNTLPLKLVLFNVVIFMGIVGGCISFCISVAIESGSLQAMMTTGAISQYRVQTLPESRKPVAVSVFKNRSAARAAPSSRLTASVPVQNAFFIHVPLTVYIPAHAPDICKPGA